MVEGLLEARGTYLVVRGNWFEKVSGHYTYKLLRRFDTVTVNSLRFLCPDTMIGFTARNLLVLSLTESLHEYIID